MEIVVGFEEEITTKLDALDRSFYQYPDDLVILLYNYVQAHRDQFLGLK